MKLKAVLKSTPGSFKHWVGWILSAVGITAFLSIFFTLPSSFLNVSSIVFIAEVTMDIFKHWAKLQ